AGALKYELRYGNINSDKRDSSAAHSFMLALLIYYTDDYFIKKKQLDIDLFKAIKIALIHDLPEAIVYDTPFFEIFKTLNASQKQKSAREEAGMKVLASKLPKSQGSETYKLWKEYETCSSDEAKFVKILDKLEGSYTSMAIGIGPGKLDADPIVHHSDKGFGWFPATDKLMKLVRKDFKKYFAENKLAWKPEYDLP
ncbi:MAG: HD domain-containing protein, partial [Proteobacteria bacterium]|nr:HD domain-containing protein [Pseudomonadota bacterium]